MMTDDDFLHTALKKYLALMIYDQDAYLNKMIYLTFCQIFPVRLKLP